MKTSEAKQILQKWLVGVTGTEVIFADQNGKMPEKPFFTLKVLAIRDGEWATELPPGEDDTVTIYNDRTFSVSAQGYGPGVIDLADEIRAALVRDTVLREFRRQGLPFIRVSGEMRDTTSEVAKRFEERVGIDLEFRAAAVAIDNPGIITGFEILGDVDGFELRVSGSGIDYTASSTRIFADSTTVTADRA